MDEPRTLSSPERIHKRREFLHVYHQGDKVHSRSFVLYVLPRGVNGSRLGLTVSRRVGGAVVRNRVKRLFREIFRSQKQALPYGCDVVINARRSASVASYKDLAREFERAIQRWQEQKRD